MISLTNSRRSGDTEMARRQNGDWTERKSAWQPTSHPIPSPQRITERGIELKRAVVRLEGGFQVADLLSSVSEPRPATGIARGVVD